jgi:exopolysaccharide production protein ExoZ
MYNDKIYSLQALRAIAALLVVARHSWQSVLVGGAGVDLFFVISGFTMVYASQKDFGHKESIVPFLTRRFMRIYPTYWACTLLMILCGEKVTTEILKYSFSLALGGNGPFILDPAWTLAYEVFFYIIFSIWLFLPLAYAVAAAIASLLVVVLGGQDTFIIGSYSNPIILEFGAGVVVGAAYCKGVRLGMSPMLATLGLGLVLFATFSILRYEPGTMWARLITWGVASVFVVSALVLGPPIAALKNKFLQLLGDASYSIYLIHWVIMYGIAKTPHYKLASFLLSAFCGAGFYILAEKPFLAYAKSKIRWLTHPKAKEPEEKARRATI